VEAFKNGGITSALDDGLQENRAMHVPARSAAAPLMWLFIISALFGLLPINSTGLPRNQSGGYDSRERLQIAGLAGARGMNASP
jgi:hypothetical protein